MKKNLVCLFFLSALFLSAHAQGTLEFSKALLVTSASATTVPSGKVWKVEQYLTQGTYKFDYSSVPSCTSGRFSGILINGITYFPKQFGVNSSGAAPMSLVGLNGPLWLPGGTALAVQCSNDLMSLLEFNIAP